MAAKDGEHASHLTRYEEGEARVHIMSIHGSGAVLLLCTASIARPIQAQWLTSHPYRRLSKRSFPINHNNSFFSAREDQPAGIRASCGTRAMAPETHLTINRFLPLANLPNTLV